MQASLARVNDETITVAELMALSPEEDRKHPLNAGTSEEERFALQHALLEHLIERKMLLQEAKRLNIQLTQKEFDAKISEMKAAMDEQALSQLMRKEETEAREAFEAATKSDLLIEKLLKHLPEQSSSKPRVVSEQEIQDYYESHPEEWEVGEELKLWQIVTQTKEEAETLYLSILDGADFEETAKANSKQSVGDGVELGYLQKQATPIEFDSLFRAEIGEISPVIKTEFGYHIVRVEDRRPARTRALKEVRDRIARTLKDKKREEVFTEWMSKLRQRTEVSIDEALLKKHS